MAAKAPQGGAADRRAGDRVLLNEFREGITGECFQAGDDGGGVEVGAGGVEVGVVLRVKRGGFFGAEIFELSGDGGTEIEKRGAGGGGGLGGPLAVTAGGLKFAVFPEVADGEGEDDGRGTLGLGVGNHFAEIPTEGVHDFVLLGDDVVDRLRLVADAGDGAARATGGGRNGCVFVDGTGVVVAKLNEDKVAGFEVGEELIPNALSDEGAAAAAAASAVGDVDFREVEVVGERLGPALLTFAASASGGGIAGDEERRECGVEGRARRCGVFGEVGGGGGGGLRGEYGGETGDDEGEDGAEFHREEGWPSLGAV